MKYGIVNLCFSWINHHQPSRQRKYAAVGMVMKKDKNETAIKVLNYYKDRFLME